MDSTCVTWEHDSSCGFTVVPRYDTTKFVRATNSGLCFRRRVPGQSGAVPSGDVAEKNIDRGNRQGHEHDGQAVGHEAAE